MDDFLEEEELSNIEEVADTLHKLLKENLDIDIDIEEDPVYSNVAEYQLECKKIKYNAKKIKESADVFVDDEFNKGFEDTFTYNVFTKMVIMHEWGHALDKNLVNILNFNDELNKTQEIEKYFMVVILMELNAWKLGRRLSNTADIPSILFDKHNAFNLEKKFNDDIKKKWGKQEELFEFLSKSNIDFDFTNYSNKQSEQLRKKLHKMLF